MSTENVKDTTDDVEQHNKCVIVMRQTDYDIEKAKNKLKEFNGDIVAIIRDYIKNDDTEKQNIIKKPSATLNQKIYGEIRDLLDDACDAYRKKKEAEEANKKRIEEIKKHIIKLKQQTKISSLFQENATSLSYSIGITVPSTENEKAELICKLKQKQQRMPLFLNIAISHGDIENIASFLQTIIKETKHTIHIHIDCSKYSLENFKLDFLKLKKLNIKHFVISSTSKSMQTTKAIQYIKTACSDNDSITVGCKGYPEGYSNDIHVIHDKSLTNTEASRAGYDASNNVQVCSDANFKKEIEYLKAKQDAGADYIISEIFYDVSVFLQFCITLREAGITIPIIPSIMPIVSYNAFTYTTSKCRTRVPNNIQNAVYTCKHNDTQCNYYGQRLAISTCKALLLRGVQHIHCYSNNDLEQCKKILKSVQFA